MSCGTRLRPLHRNWNLHMLQESSCSEHDETQCMQLAGVRMKGSSCTPIALCRSWCRFQSLKQAASGKNGGALQESKRLCNTSQLRCGDCMYMVRRALMWCNTFAIGDQTTSQSTKQQRRTAVAPAPEPEVSPKALPSPLSSRSHTWLSENSTLVAARTLTDASSLKQSPSIKA
jgi:hypothetical protein